MATSTFVGPLCAVVMMASASACAERAPVATLGRVERRTAHFVIEAEGVDSTAVAALAAYLEANRAGVLSDLGNPQLGTTRVVIQSKQEFDRQWGALVASSGLRFQPTGLTGPDGTTSAFIASRDSVGKRLRWLSESIALYEAGQSTDLNRHGYLLRGHFPSIAELNDISNSQVYDVGYRLAEFIKWRFGGTALQKLIRANGDVRLALGVSEDELMRQWFLRIEDRYLLIKPRWFTRDR